ncbi:unnamed protein product [Peronospora destructor]|uniref:Retroviral polymerase SH3-like domain-containing protein n=1 Tax=Peronospora destructor TaxID=86335 RepID=A0AAV0USV2_9STRA|nr:unnamed protein product [Peronospora destructor]
MNRTVSATRATGNDKSPHEAWTQKKPLLKNLKVFGCHAYVHIPREKRSKLDARSVLCRFLGYSDHEKAYRFEELSSSRVAVSRDTRFMEDVFDSGKHGQVGSSKTVETKDVDDATDSEDSGDRSNQDEDEGMEELRATLAPTHKRPSVPRSMNARPQWQQQQTPRQQPQQSQQPNVEYPPGSKRHSRAHSLEVLSAPPVEKHYGRVGRTSGASSTPAPGSRSSLDDMPALLASTEEEEECAHVVYSVGDLPMSFESAMESSDASKWMEACDSEFKSLCKNETWELVSLPHDKAISSNWVFKGADV